VRVEKWQSQGQWRARHFDKVVLNLPIPHLDIAQAAEEAEMIAKAVPVKSGTHFTCRRKTVRGELAASGVAKRIDDYIDRLLTDPLA
jgi:hypothetical protein